MTWLRSKVVDIMTNQEIKKELKVFERRIFNMKAAEAMRIKEELDAFIKANGVTADQMMEFAQSGAGEELYMCTC